MAISSTSFKKGHPFMGDKDNFFKVGHTPWNKGKKMFDYLRENSPRWNGGTHIHKGYVYIYNPDHLQATQSGYVKEHRLVMEKFLGRPLEKGEVIHHLDGDKENNKVENLVLFANHREHMKSFNHKGGE